MFSQSRSLKLAACTLIVSVFAISLTGESVDATDLFSDQDSNIASSQPGIYYHTDSLEYSGSALWSGPQDAVFYRNWLICATSEGFATLNMRNPSSAVIRRQLYPDNNLRPIEMAVSGSTLYIATRESSSTQTQRVLAAFDISDPSTPVLRGYLYNTYFTNCLAVSGDYAVLNSGATVNIVDVSDVTNMRIVGRFNCQPNDTPGGIVIRDTLVFIAADRFYILNIADPTQPKLVSRTASKRWAQDVSIQGDFAYIADRDIGRPATGSSFSVIDISQLDNPQLVASYDFCCDVFSVQVQDSVALVAAGRSGTLLFDISNPLVPSLVDCYYTGNRTMRVRTAGAVAVVIESDVPWLQDYGEDMCDSAKGSAAGTAAQASCTNTGLVSLLDISNAADLRLLDSFAHTGNSQFVFHDGKFIYVVDEQGLITTLEVSYDGSMREVSSLRIPCAPQGAAFNNGVLYCSDLDAGVFVMEADRHGQLTQVSLCQDCQSISGMVVTDNMLYTNFYISGCVGIYDLSDNRHPVMDSYVCPGRVDNLIVSDGYLYLSDGEIYDVSSPQTPRLLSRIPQSGTCLARTGNLLLMGGFHGLSVIDVSDPEHPVQIGHDSNPASGKKMVVRGNLAFVTMGDNGVAAFDISNPSSPRRFSGYDTPGSANGLAVDDRYLYVADYYGLLQLRKPDLIPTDVEESAADNMLPTFEIRSNYPNPFNATTTIQFDLPRSAEVSLSVRNVLGEHVATLVHRRMSAGAHQVTWSGKNDAGADVASGVYFLELRAEGATASRKVLLLK